MIDGNQVVEEEEKDNERKFREELLIAGMEEQLYGKMLQSADATTNLESRIPTLEASTKLDQVALMISSIVCNSAVSPHTWKSWHG